MTPDGIETVAMELREASGWIVVWFVAGMCTGWVLGIGVTMIV